MSFVVYCVINGWGAATPVAQIRDQSNNTVGSPITTGYSLGSGILKWGITVADSTAGSIDFYASGSPTPVLASIAFPEVVDVREVNGQGPVNEYANPGTDFTVTPVNQT